jgi:hypothetical protein
MKTANINGVILTDKAIDQLKRLQDENNGLLKSNIKMIHDMAKHVVNESVWSASDDGKARSVLILTSGLYSICDAFENLCATSEEGGDA